MYVHVGALRFLFSEYACVTFWKSFSILNLLLNIYTVLEGNQERSCVEEDAFYATKQSELDKTIIVIFAMGSF